MTSTTEEGCTSPGMTAALQVARIAAKSNSTVLLLGENGSGKDFLAEKIHQWSGRRDKPFVHVNCSSIPAALFESELFGHERGAFTGALDRRVGLIETAQGGTLLLNEIGEMPLHLQPKLLTFLDTHQNRRVGGRLPIPADVRIIAATNRDLDEMVALKTFRADLFFRLSVLKIRVPPLREWIEDLPALARQFLRELSKTSMVSWSPCLCPETLRVMELYTWPGNVRELRGILERCLVLSKCEHDMNELIIHEIESQCKSASVQPPPSDNKREPPIIQELIRQAAGKRVRNPSFSQKQRLYQECIVERGWKQKDIAKRLGVSEATVSNWLSEVSALSEEFPARQAHESPHGGTSEADRRVTQGHEAMPN